MKKITMIIIALIICISLPNTAFAATGGSMYGTSVPNPYAYLQYNSNYEQVWLDYLSIAVPKKWDYQFDYTESEMRCIISSPNGYEINLVIYNGTYTMSETEDLGLNYDADFYVSNVDKLLYSVSKLETSIITDSSNTMYYYQQVSPADQPAVIGEMTGWFYPRFYTPDGKMAEMYGYQGEFKCISQCKRDAQIAKLIMKSLTSSYVELPATAIPVPTPKLPTTIGN